MLLRSLRNSQMHHSRVARTLHTALLPVKLTNSVRLNDHHRRFLMMKTTSSINAFGTRKSEIKSEEDEEDVPFYETGFQSIFSSATDEDSLGSMEDLLSEVSETKDQQPFGIVMPNKEIDLDNLILKRISSGILKNVPALLMLLRSVPIPQVPSDFVLNEIFMHYMFSQNESAMKLVLLHLNRYVGEENIALRFKNLYLKTLIDCNFETEAIKVFQAMRQRWSTQDLLKSGGDVGVVDTRSLKKKKTTLAKNEEQGSSEVDNVKDSVYHDTIASTNLNFVTFAIMIRNTSRQIFPTIKCEIFDGMIRNRYHDFSPTAYSYLYNCMLEKMVRLRKYNDAIQLFSEMTQNGISDEYLTNSSDENNITMTQPGPKPPLPNLISFCILMKAFWSVRDLQRANDLYMKIHQQIGEVREGVEQEIRNYHGSIEGVQNVDDYTYGSLITSVESIYEITCEGLSPSVKRMKDVVKQMMENGYKPTIKMYNDIMHAEIIKYRKKSPKERQLLEQKAQAARVTQQKDGEAENTSLNSLYTPAPKVFNYGFENNPDESLLISPSHSMAIDIVDAVLMVCKEMYDEHALLPDGYSMRNLMEAFCLTGQPEQAYKVMINTLKRSRVSKAMMARLYSVLIRYYSNNDPDRALELIEEMSQSTIVVGETLREDDHGNIQSVAIEQGKAVFIAGVEEMNSILRVYCNRNQLNKALEILQQMTEKYAIVPDKYTKMILAAGYMSSRLPYKAVDLLSDVFEEDTGLRLDIYAASGLYFNVKKRKKDKVNVLLNQILQTYIRRRDLANAEYMIYQGMPNSQLMGGFIPDTTSVNSFMELLIATGRLNSAINVFKTMFRSPLDSGSEQQQSSHLLTPNDTTITIIINAYAISDYIERAEDLFEKVQNGSLASLGVPKVTTGMYNSLIAGYERMGDVRGVRVWTEKFKLFQTSQTKTDQRISS